MLLLLSYHVNFNLNSICLQHTHPKIYLISVIGLWEFLCYSNSPLDTFYKDFLAQLNKIYPFQEAMFICVKERQTLSATYVDLWLLIKDTPMVKQVLKRF